MVHVTSHRELRRSDGRQQPKPNRCTYTITKYPVLFFVAPNVFFVTVEGKKRACYCILRMYLIKGGILD